MSKKLNKQEALQELDNFLDNDQFDDIVTETLIATHSTLKFCVYHQARLSSGEVYQRFKIVHGGEVYYRDFGSEIKPLLKALV